MRRMLVCLLVFLLVLGYAPGGYALTITDADIEYPIFPWGDYTLQLSLYTDDAELVNYTPTPAEGTLVMLRLTGLSGQIALADIESGAEQFVLRDATDATYTPSSWRVNGVQFKDGEFSTNDMQDAFELIYYLPAGVSAGGAALLVGDVSAKERIIVQLPEQGQGDQASEPIPEITPQATPEITPEPTLERTAEPAPESDAATVLTSPESATIVFEGESYLIRPSAIGRDQDGKTYVVLDGYGSVLSIRNGEMIAHIQASIFAGGQEYDWQGMALDDGKATFTFDTDLTPEIIYLYAYGEADNRTALTVLASGTDGIVDLIEAAEPAETEPAAEPDETEPTAESESMNEPDADAFLEELLLSEADKASDPWTRAILMHGAWYVELDDAQIHFTLRSFNPGLEELGDYDEGMADYLYRLYENASAVDLECALPVTREGGAFSASDADVKALLKVVSSAAIKSKSGFDDKRVRIALADYLLNGETISDDLGWDMNAQAFAPLFAAQTKQSLSVADGPHALKLNCTAAVGTELVQGAYESATVRLSKQAYANELFSEEIEEVFREELNAQAASLKKSGTKAVVFVLDIDGLLGSDGTGDPGEDFNDYLTEYAEAYDEWLNELIENVWAMPDIPALDFPKSGRMSGSSKGTKVIFKIPSDDTARYIQMRESDTDEVVVTAFIRPGGSATVYVPKGYYYIMVAAGEMWYGTEYLFGDDGEYSSTDEVEIKGSSYYHTITLGGAEDGNMSSYDADPSDFQ